MRLGVGSEALSQVDLLSKVFLKPNMLNQRCVRWWYMDKEPYNVHAGYSLRGWTLYYISALTARPPWAYQAQLKYLRSYPSSASQPNSGFTHQEMVSMQPPQLPD
jgi:hypothetical protein